MGYKDRPCDRSATHLLLITSIWTIIITDCLSIGLRTARSPGVTIPHFVTTNRLNEKPFLPKLPFSSPDYESLLARVNGDFGIKSAIVKAAEEDPVYKGAQTLVVPLYIPEGAVPIRLARVSRSGDATSKKITNRHVRFHSRRSRLPVTGNGRGGPRRTQSFDPTESPILLRGWGRRIAPKATSRVGLHDDSETSASQSLKTFDVIRSKNDRNNKNLSSSEVPVATSPDSSMKLTSLATSLETVTEAYSSSTELKKTVVVPDFLDTVSTQFPAPVNLVPNKTLTHPHSQSNNSSAVLRQDFTTPVSLLTDTTSKNGTNKHDEETIAPTTKSSKKVFGFSSRVLRSSTPPPLKPTTSKLTLKSRKEQAKQRVSLLSSRSRLSASRIPTESTTTEKRNIQNQSTVEIVSHPSTRRLPFPPRLKTVTSSTTESSKAENDVSVKPLVNDVKMKANSRLPLFRWKAHEKDSSRNTQNATTTTETTVELKPTEVLERTKSKTNFSTTHLPIRHRKPLRNKLSYLEPNSSVVGFPPLSTVPPPISLLPLISTTTEDSLLKITTTDTSRTTLQTTTASINIYKEPMTIAQIRYTSKAPITTTSSPVRRTHKFFKSSPKRNIQADKNNRNINRAEQTESVQSSTFPTTVAYSSINTWRTPANRKEPKPFTNNSSITTATPNAKSPAEIVLASLSEVMRGAANGNKDKFREISSNLDTLNKQLAERGILIIHAEVDGKIIKLRNHTSVRNSSNFTLPERNIRPKNKVLGKNNGSEQETQLSQSLSNSDDSITTVFTPSDKLEYDIVLKNDGGLRSESDRYSDSVYSVNDEVTNQKSTTPNTSETTTLKNTVSNIITNSVVSTTQAVTSKVNLKDEYINKYSLQTESSVSSSEITSDSQTTTNKKVTYHEGFQPTTDHNEADSTLNNSDGSQFVNPSSHMRPKVTNVKAEVIPELSPILNESSSRILDELKSNSISEDDHFKEQLLLREDLHSSHSSENAEENLNKSQSNSSVYLVSMVGIFPLAGLAAFVVRKFLRGDTHRKTLPESEERPDGFTPPTHHHVRAHSILPSPPDSKSVLPDESPSPWEFNRSKLRLVSVLGEGNFGVVWKAEARGFCNYSSGASTVLVAVKMVKDCAGAKEKSDLVRELSVMQLLGPHPNVVSLLGCCTQSEPHLVIMEYVMFGKLLTFLRDHRTRHNYFNFSSDTAALTSRDLTRFASHIANGCDYLQSRGIIHRDLAARNILVDHNKVCKIADFGMARSIQDIGSDIYEQKSKGALPIRWMAPESLYMNIFTHKSDVWSFGILCWEIVTLGSTPYPGLTAREVMRQVTEGYRLERPDHCRPELYRLLATCWQQDLNKRPSFHQLKLELNSLMEHQTGYIDLENFPEDDYFSMHQNNDEKL